MFARIGRIPFLNAAPFYLLMDEAQLEVRDLAPRRMGEAARAGTVDAGPFSLVDWLGMRDAFPRLGNFGIALTGEARSVLLFSKVPLARLGAHARVGLDDASTTGAMLGRVILRERYGIMPVCVRGDDPEADAKVIIGDAALVANTAGIPGYPEKLDLGQAWWDWHRLPFVFAVWAADLNLPAAETDGLKDLIAHSLKLWMEPHGSSERYADWSKRTGLPADDLRAYIARFTYALGPDEEEAIMIFEQLVRRVRAEEAAYAVAPGTR